MTLSFEEQRGKLFGIAYRMLGTAMDAEDIVQDAWLRYQKLEQPPDNPQAYLRKVVTNLSLDYLKSARIQREEYIGEWLPEPIATDKIDDPVSKVEHISMAFLVMLETLSPRERAVFILREVFDYDYDEIADILDISYDACRTILTRARKHLRDNRPRFDATPETHDKLVTNFITAIQQGDLEPITSLLAEDVSLYSDGGGKVPAATRPLHGRETIIKFLLGIQKRALDMGIAYQIHPIHINGEQGMIARETTTHQTLFVATFETHKDHITVLRFVRNPDKLMNL